MKTRHISAILLAGLLAVSVLAGCGNQAAGTVQETVTDTKQETDTDAGKSTLEDEQQDKSVDAEQESLAETENDADILMIVKQGMFSSGGTVTEPFSFRKVITATAVTVP